MPKYDNPPLVEAWIAFDFEPKADKVSWEKEQINGRWVHGTCQSDNSYIRPVSGCQFFEALTEWLMPKPDRRVKLGQWKV